MAAYTVCEALGWDLVPRTFLRDGPHGRGMVQLWREPDAGQAAVTIVPEGEVPPGFRHVFDGVDEHDQPISLVHEDRPRYAGWPSSTSSSTTRTARADTCWR